LQPFG